MASDCKRPWKSCGVHKQANRAGDLPHALFTVKAAHYSLAIDELHPAATAAAKRNDARPAASGHEARQNVGPAEDAVAGPYERGSPENFERPPNHCGTQTARCAAENPRAAGAHPCRNHAPPNIGEPQRVVNPGARSVNGDLNAVASPRAGDGPRCGGPCA